MTNQINDGGPAFPQPDLQFPNGEVQYGSPGMTLRDYFAASEKLDDIDITVIFDIAIAISGPRPKGSWTTNPIEWLEWDAKWRAKMRFIRADAMIQAREVKP